MNQFQDFTTTIKSTPKRVCRTLKVYADPNVFINNDETICIINLEVEDYGTFELYNGNEILFKAPNDFGESGNEIVTGDVMAIIKCLKRFGCSVSVLDLFPMEQKQNAFMHNVNVMIDELVANLSIPSLTYIITGEKKVVR